MSKIIRSDKYYVPKEDVNKKKLDHFEFALFREAGCAPCEYKDERICDVCEECPNFGGLFKFHDKVNIKGKKYISFAAGQRKLLEKAVPSLKNGSNSNVKDKRLSIPSSGKLKMKVKGRDYQEEAMKKMIKYDEGLLISPPRSGKTVIAAMMTVQLGQRTLILAHQHDLISQFHDTFYGSEKNSVLEFTNARSLEEKRGHPVVKVAETRDDFFDERYEVVLSTYQKLSSELGKIALKKICKLFGLIITDEIHKGAATTYATTLSKFHAKYRYGLTATKKRKDCVTGESLISTESGPVEIRNLKVGDRVWSDNNLGGKELQPILETHKRKDSKVYLLEYEGGYLKATGDHEVWCVNREDWVALKDLTTDDAVRIDEH